MISRNAIPRYIEEKNKLIKLVNKMKKSKLKNQQWIKDCISSYQKRIERIDELIEQRLEWDSNPLCIATDQMLGRNQSL